MVGGSCDSSSKADGCVNVWIILDASIKVTEDAITPSDATRINCLLDRVGFFSMPREFV